jgi:hypothetical protein
VVAVVAATLVGCGAGGTTVGVGFGPALGPIPPGERAEAHITVRFGGPGDSWAGRKAKVCVGPPPDVTVEPAESEVTLDSSGSADVRVYITPDKSAAPGPRTLAITATGSETASTTLSVEVTVK